MTLLGWIIVGFLAGVFARAVTGGKARWDLGCLGTIVVGVVGAFIGGWLFSLAGDDDVISEFGLRSVFVAFVGAVILLVVAGLFTGKFNRGR